jgi:tRNA threonylcarbamoyladenosine biosynthesis protein TsaB
MLAGNGARLGDLRAIVVVSGPGSFTGVRVGLSAVKGLAEPAQIPVVAVSRLEVLAKKSGVAPAALDAHRHEVYLRVGAGGGDARELLAGAEELTIIEPRPAQVVVCDDGAAAMVHKAWPDIDLVRTQAPDASDAMRLALPRILASQFDDVALIDGHYLRRSDAEIFGEPGAAAARPKKGQSK